MRRWALAAFALVLAILVVSGAEPWRGVLAGFFAPTDLAQDLAAARVFAAGENPYEVGIAPAHAALMNVSPDQGYPYYPHPPLLFLLLLPISAFTLQQAAFLWFGVSLGLLLLLAALLADAAAGPVHPARETSRLRVSLVFVALLVWPPVLVNLTDGQWSIVIAVLLTVSWYGRSRGRHALTGASVGFACAVKLFPAVLGLYFLLRAPRAVIWMGGAVVAALVLPLVWMGPQTVSAFIEQSRGNLSYWESFQAVHYSGHGLLARLLVGGQWSRPWMEAPIAARLLSGLAALGCWVWWSGRLGSLVPLTHTRVHDSPRG